MEKAYSILKKSPVCSSCDLLPYLLLSNSPILQYYALLDLKTCKSCLPLFYICLFVCVFVCVCVYILFACLFLRGRRLNGSSVDCLFALLIVAFLCVK